jgi:hypothetical protein
MKTALLLWPHVAVGTSCRLPAARLRWHDECHGSYTWLVCRYDSGMTSDSPHGAYHGEVRNEMHGAAHNVVQAGSIGQVNLGASAAAKRITVEVVHEPGTVEVRANDMDFIYPWVEAERSRLLALADDYEWPQNVRSGDWLDYHHLVRKNDFPDLRTRGMYEANVEDYLMQASQVFTERALLLIEDHLPSCVQLAVDNPTDLHFRGIAFRMWFERSARGFDDGLRYRLPLYWPELPAIPAAPGTRGDYLTHRKVLSAPHRVIGKTRGHDADKGMDVLAGWSGEELEEGGIVVTFNHFDLRPRQRIYLPPVPVRVLVNPGSTLTGHWAATAEDANGECSGELVFAVTLSTVNLAELAEPGPPDENLLPPAELITMLAAGFVASRLSRKPRADGA